MRCAIIVLLLPTWLYAQEFQFQQEYDSIPVEIASWPLFVPWFGGFSESNPALVDIDADGDFDLFVGVFVGDLNYFCNEGTYTNPQFTFTSYSFDSIQVEDRLNPEFGDLEFDGDLDLLIGEDGDGWLFVYINTGTQQQPIYQREDTLNGLGIGPPWCTDPVLIDIDADGDYDLFGGNLGTVSFYRNIGTPQLYNFNLITGNFENINIGDHAAPELIDIDGDGDYDLFIGNELGKIWFYRNDGDSSSYDFTFVSNNYANIDVGEEASPEFADIDGDSDFDLFIGREQMSTITSPGDIFFYENIGIPQEAQWNLMTKNYISIDVGYTAQSTTTDIDADGDRDLFIQHIGARLSFFENSGTPDSSSYHWVTDNYQDISVTDAFPKFCDIDADQDPDLFMGEAVLPNPPYPGLYLFQNHGTPQTASFSLFSNNLVPGTYEVSIAPALADVDADGDYDLFLSDQDRHFYYFQNIGTATTPIFLQQSTNWQSVYYPGCPSLQLYPTFYDIDDDQDLDLFLGTAYGWNQLWFYRNIGTPQNAVLVLETQTFLGEGLRQFSGIDIFDIDQDGDGDFMLSTLDGSMVFFRNITGQSPVDPRKRPTPTYPKIDLILQPNPGNPASIVFSLPYPQEATLAVYNLLGAKVATLASGWQPGGEQRFFWETAGKASGVYIVRLEAEQQVMARKMVLLK